MMFLKATVARLTQNKGCQNKAHLRPSRHTCLIGSGVHETFCGHIYIYIYIYISYIYIYIYIYVCVYIYVKDTAMLG